MFLCGFPQLHPQQLTASTDIFMQTDDTYMHYNCSICDSPLLLGNVELKNTNTLLVY